MVVPDEAESARLERLGHGVRFRRAGGNVALTAPAIVLRSSADKAPDESIEAAELLLHQKQCLRVADSALHLQAIAHDRWICQERLDAAAVEAGDPRRVELGKRRRR